MILDKTYKAIHRLLKKETLPHLSQLEIRNLAERHGIDISGETTEETRVILVDAYAKEIENENTLDIEIIKTTQLVEDKNKLSEDESEIDKTTSDLAIKEVSAITFTEPFSKALAVKNNTANGQIELTDSQVFEIATSIPDTFNSQLELTQTILNFIHEKYDLESLRTRLIVDESLDSLVNKQQQFRQEINTKVQKTMSLMAENSKKYKETDMKLLKALKAGFNNGI